MNRVNRIPVGLAARCLMALVLLSGAPAVAQQSGDADRPEATNGCPVHVVQRGDALWELAEGYLGSRHRADDIYRANRRMIGRNPNIIEPGQRLTIPCDPAQRQQDPPQLQQQADAEPDPITEPVRDIVATPEGGLPAPAPNIESGADALAAEMLRQEAGIPEGAEAPAAGFRGLAGGPISPFIDRGLPMGGIAVALVDAAFAAVKFAPPRWSDGGPPHIRLDAALDYLIGDKLE